MAHQRARGHRRTAREAVVTIAGVTGNTEARALLWESIAMSAGTNSADGSSTAALGVGCATAIGQETDGSSISPDERAPNILLTAGCKQSTSNCSEHLPACQGTFRILF